VVLASEEWSVSALCSRLLAGIVFATGMLVAASVLCVINSEVSVESISTGAENANIVAAEMRSSF
jgi:hypothetical protein